MRGARSRKLGRIFPRLHERDRIGADVGFAARSLDRLGQIGRHGRGVEGDAFTASAQILDEREQGVGLEHVRMAAEISRLASESFLPSRNTTGRPTSGR